MVFPERSLEVFLKRGPLFIVEHWDGWFQFELFIEAFLHLRGALVRRTFAEVFGIGLASTGCKGHHVHEKSAHQFSPPFKCRLSIFLRRDALVWDAFGFHEVDAALIAVALHEEIEVSQT